MPVYGGILLSLEKMKKIQEIDEANFTATVEPGVTLAELYKALGEHGLYYPVYPGETPPTIGGTISGEHGLGVVKKGFLPLAADPAKIELMRRIKHAFDPNHIMNPGKVLDF
ncbi:MAG: FAD-linked oxidase C-terminal domain-containing protein [Chloroflexota bacterium]